MAEPTEDASEASVLGRPAPAPQGALPPPNVVAGSTKRGRVELSNNNEVGSLCLFDARPRPGSLCAADRATLSDLAATAETVIDDRQHRRRMEERHAQLVAHTAHDLMTPLTGLQLSLSLLTEDKEFREKLSEHQREVLSTVAKCSDVMTSICKESIESLREERGACAVSTSVLRVPTTTTNSSSSKQTVFLTDLVKNLHQVRVESILSLQYRLY